MHKKKISVEDKLSHIIAVCLRIMDKKKISVEDKLYAVNLYHLPVPM